MISPEQLIAAGPSGKLSEEQSPTTRVAIETDVPKDIAEKPFDSKAFDSLKEDDETSLETSDTPPVKKDEKVEKELQEEEAKTKAREEALKKQEEQKKAEDTTKKETETKDENKDKKFEIQPITSKKPAGERDYSGFTDAEAEILKKTSNEAFELAKSRILELKQVKEEKKQLEDKLTRVDKQELPESYYEHPKSYILDEKWNTAMASVHVLENEIVHWEKQMEAVEKGEEWIRLDGRNQDGTYKVTKMPASVEAKTLISRAINQGHLLIREHAAVASQIEQTTQQRAQSLKAEMKKREDFLFSEFADDKKFFESNTYGKAMKNYLSSGGLGNNILISGFCKMYAKLMEYQDKIDKFETEKQVVKVEEKVKESNGPSSGEVNKGITPTTKDEPVSLDEKKFDLAAFEKLTKDE
jgi:hypothetical protein